MKKAAILTVTLLCLVGLSACGGGSSTSGGAGNGSLSDAPTSISWMKPTTNTDSSSLSNLFLYRFYYGPTADSLKMIFEVEANSSKLSTTNGRTTLETDALDAVDLENLIYEVSRNSSHYYAISAVNTANVEGPLSSVIHF